jgi:hypothetical protein
VKYLTPSQRGELKITDLNLLYVQRRQLTLERLGRGFAWFDPGVILHIKPVAHIAAIPVDGQLASLATFDDRQRNELLWKMKRSIVVGTIGNQYRQIIGAMPTADKVVGRGLGSRIRRSRRVGCRFVEDWLFSPVSARPFGLPRST